MARAATTFRQSDIARAIKGAVKAGAQIERAEIDPTGKIVLIFAGAAEGDRHISPLDKWRAAHGAR